jgi:putative phage-type endonuclease
MTLSSAEMEIRSKGIGASEAAPVLGIDRWSSPTDVWMRKLGLVEDTETFHSERGTFLEPALREWGCARLKARFEPCTTLVHPEHPLILATPDGVLRDGNRTVAVLELKSPGPNTWDEWGSGEDDAPDRYVVQVSMQLAVTGAEVGYIAALLDGDLKIYRIERDRELERAMIPRLESWWRDYVETKTPPPVDGSQAAGEYLLKRFPSSGEAMLKADMRGEELLAQLAKIEMAWTDMEKSHAVLSQQIKEIIGGAKGLESSGIGRATWTNRKGSASTDWEALCRDLKATEEQIRNYTSVRPGTRAFRFWPPKEK